MIQKPLLLVVLLIFISSQIGYSQCLNTDVTTLAGSAQGFIDVDGSSALFDHPSGLVVDPAGNIYVADAFNHSIRKITSSGDITTLAGTGTPGFVDGPGSSAQFNNPVDIEIDASGNLYVADDNNHSIRKITPDGTVSTYAGTGIAGYTDGIGSSAQFNHPLAIAIDGSGNLFIGDNDNFKIRKIDALGMVTTLAGSTKGFADGLGSDAQFDGPSSLAVDGSGMIFVADALNNRIRLVTPAGMVSTYAGDGTAGLVNGARLDAQFQNPLGVEVDLAGNVYVADAFNNTIRKISSSGTVTTLAGSTMSGFEDGLGADAKFHLPSEVAIDAAGILYVADAGNHSIRQVSALGAVTTLAGSEQGFEDGSAAEAKFDNPLAVTVDLDGNVFVADRNNHSIRKIRPNGQVSTYAGTGTPGLDNGERSSASFNNPVGVVVDDFGVIYVADILNQCIRKIDVDGNVSTLAGSSPGGHVDGTGLAAKFSFPSGIALDDLGNLYVADAGNHRIRMINAAGEVSTIAGSGANGHQDGDALTAEFSFPTGVVLDETGNIFVADSRNHRIRKIATNGMVSTYAGNGTGGFADGSSLSAQFDNPTSVAIDESGNIYVSDAFNNRIRLIPPGGTVSTLAGNGTAGFEDGPAESAMFDSPSGIAVDAYGNAYIADAFNHRIRKIGNCRAPEIVPTIGEWGVFVLCLLLVIIAVVSIKQGSYNYGTIATLK